MAVTGQDLIINRADLTEAQVVSASHDDTPPEGQVLLRVGHFALTANTITYGTASRSLGYWNFFPAQREGFGRIPAWGFADVIASALPEIAVGTRVYGYVPMSTHLMVQPGKLGRDGLSDMAAHRQPMAPIYNRYGFTAADPAYARDLEAQIAVFRPLFTTSFLLADFFREHAMFGARQLLMSSASSKTAIGLAAEMSRDKPSGLSLVGLTSARNIGFVQGLGLYDRVLAYDDLASLPGEPAAYVDFSGNGDLLMRLHTQFGQTMCHTAQVGLTDWQNAQLKIPGLPGPKPAFFFAPAYAQQRIADWGMAGFQARLGEAWGAFMATTGWLKVRALSGPEAVRARYVSALSGTFDPSEGEMLSMWEG